MNYELTMFTEAMQRLLLGIIKEETDGDDKWQKLT
jgi:hypothetical protein